MNFLDSVSAHTIHAHGVPYKVYEGGGGVPLMLLHGFSGAAVSWRHVLPRLTSRFRVIVPDLLGHGETGAPEDPVRYGIELQSADLVAILDALNIDRVGMHGYSMGGRLALYAAIVDPSRFSALSLESASPGLDTEAERLARRQSDERLAARIIERGINQFVDEWEQLPLFATQSALPAQVIAAQRATRLNQRPLGLANSLRGMGTGAQPSLWDRLDELSMPVQLMTGALDAKFEAIADRMAPLIPHARRVHVPDAGHTVYLEQPELWLDALALFFA
jgi:2-succinyl-6-hydroxy-2,4-cyclohexadiene-1-carboxylate synthase